MSNDVPAGYIPLLLEAWTNGEEVVLLGEAPGEDVDPKCELHNCDQMGCGAFGPHVVARFENTSAWLRWQVNEILKVLECSP